MAHGKEPQRGRQQQTSRQSGVQGGQTGAGTGEASSDVRPGIGSSQGQDKPSKDEQRDAPSRPSAGTPDIERGSGGDAERSNTNVEDSLVGESTGAFKALP